MALAIEVKEDELFQVGEALIMFKKRRTQYVFYVFAPKEVRVLREKLIKPERLKEVRTSFRIKETA